MKPQPICTQGIHYIAENDPFVRSQNSTNPGEERPEPVEERTWCEDTSLRGLVAQMHALGLSDVTQVSIPVTIEGWDFPLEVPKDVYALSSGGKWFLRSPEDVPQFWHFPAPYVYFALDWQSGLYLEGATLKVLVQRLKERGYAFVSSLDLKIGARFAREDSEADDVVQVPLSLLCYDYDPEDENVIEIDEGWDEDEVDGEWREMCSPLPRQAELLPGPEGFTHFLFANKLVQQCRLKRLLQNEKPTS